MIYERLREHLDSMPAGYPRTESGVEMKILRKLFTEEEAELACLLTLTPETAAAVALRLGRDASAVAALLDRMSRKGLILRVRGADGYQYLAAMFLVGFFEYQVGTMDQELAALFGAYASEAMHRQMIRPETPQLRVVPVEESLDPLLEVQPYDALKTLVATQKTIALAECICRKKSALLGKPCDKPLESCLVFGVLAEYYIENGIGRRISPEEAKDVLRRNEAAGLVPSPANAQKVGGLCSCCSCCCEVLKAIKLDAHPARLVKSNFAIRLDGDLCVACGVCLERCQMEALALREDSLDVDLKRCVGCGLCVTACPTGALALQQKPPEDLYVPPARPVDTYRRIAQEMGKG